MDAHEPELSIVKCFLGPTLFEILLVFGGIMFAVVILLIAWWRYMARSDAERRRRLRPPDDFALPHP